MGSMIVSSCYRLLCLHLGFLGHKITQSLKTGSEVEVNQLNGYMGYGTSVSCLQSSIFIISKQRVWGKNLKYVKHAFSRVLSNKCEVVNVIITVVSYMDIINRHYIGPHVWAMYRLCTHYDRLCTHYV